MRVKNPTIRWVFQIMEGINIVNFYDNNAKGLYRSIITNLSDLRKKIICLFGLTACKLYGLIQKNISVALEM